MNWERATRARRDLQYPVYPPRLSPLITLSLLRVSLTVSLSPFHTLARRPSLPPSLPASRLPFLPLLFFSPSLSPSLPLFLSLSLSLSLSLDRSLSLSPSVPLAPSLESGRAYIRG